MRVKEMDVHAKGQSLPARDEAVASMAWSSRVDGVEERDAGANELEAVRRQVRAGLDVTFASIQGHRRAELAL